MDKKIFDTGLKCVECGKRVVCYDDDPPGIHFRCDCNKSILYNSFPNKKSFEYIERMIDTWTKDGKIKCYDRVL